MSVSGAEPSTLPATYRMQPADYAVYATALLVWGTSWYAIKLQVGVVAPEVSVFWRFSLAAAIMAAWVAVAGRPFRFPLAMHLRFAAMGVAMYSSNFALFYVAGQYVASGLLAVIFSLASILNVLFAAALFGERLEGRVVAGAVLGVTGVVCLFLPEIAGTRLNAEGMFALALGLGGVLSFSCGNMVARTVQQAGVSLMSQNMWGMVYGSLWIGLIAVFSGKEFTVDPTVTYLGSLLWLAVFSTVVAFAAYLTLMRRIGPGRVGYITVMFPVVALSVSTLLEGYQWSPIAGLGVALALSGNYLVLTRPA